MPSPHTAPVLRIPEFERDSNGKPVIDLRPESLYAYAAAIRATEQLLLELFAQGMLSGTTHTCLGQELCQMSVVRALSDPDDAVLSNHRNHGHFLTYSGDFQGLVAEIMGREGGVCGGRGGSQHLAFRHFHSNGVQGGMTAIGAGMALARKRRGSSGIVAVLIGDGTLGQGLVYETLNLAGIWHAPLLMVVENNGIAQTTFTSETIAGSIEARGAAFGLPVWHYADDDPEVFAKVEAVVTGMRRSGGPGFLVLDTMRMGPHSKGDDLRDAVEMERIRRRDPLARLGASLPADVRRGIDARTTEFLERVRDGAANSPEARYTVAPRHIFEGQAALPPPSPAVPSASKVIGCLNLALRQILASSERAVLIGEDLHDPYGGAFKVTAKLSTDFPAQLIASPISEAGMVGSAIGLALSGFRPIVEVMFADFITLAADQIYNHAVKFPGVFSGMKLPLVIRTPAGGRRGYGPTHSQSPEHLFTSVPGLTVVFPSQRHEPGTLLVRAAAWDYPVLFLEHKLLYAEAQGKGDYIELPAADDDTGAAWFPTLVRRRIEPDVTILTYGGMTPVVERAVQRLEDEEELSVEIVLPSLLSPLPRATLAAHLRGRRAIAIVEEAPGDFGVGAEIAASLVEAGWRGSLCRIAAPPVPIPSARSLEVDILPDEDRICREVLRLLRASTDCVPDLYADSFAHSAAE
jgi:2-oxoisovalerate dehydrogenase E1 component